MHAICFGELVGAQRGSKAEIFHTETGHFANLATKPQRAHALTMSGTNRWTMKREAWLYWNENDDVDEKEPAHYAVWEMRESNRLAREANMNLPRVKVQLLHVGHEVVVHIHDA